MYRRRLNKHFGCHLDSFVMILYTVPQSKDFCLCCAINLVAGAHRLSSKPPDTVSWLNAAAVSPHSCLLLMGALLSLGTGNPESISESLPFSAELPQSPD